MIWYCTTLNHFGNAALVWKLVSLPIELLGLLGWWWWVGGGPLGPMCFMFYAQGPLSLCLPMCLVYFTERHLNTLFSIPMRQISLWLKFDCQWSDPNCKVAHMLAQGVRVKVELIRSRHHRGSGCAPDPAHLSNEYFDKFVGWQQRHINLSDHNSKIKYSNLESGARTKICRCWLADHFTQVCRPPTLSCHRRRRHPHHFHNHHHHHHYRHVIIVMIVIVMFTLPYHTMLNCYHFHCCHASQMILI